MFKAGFRSPVVDCGDREADRQLSWRVVGCLVLVGGGSSEGWKQSVTGFLFAPGHRSQGGTNLEQSSTGALILENHIRSSRMSFN